MNLNNPFAIITLIWIISEIALARLKRSGRKTSGQDKSSLRVLWAAIILSVLSAVLVSMSGYGTMHSERAGLALIGLALIVIGLIIRWVAILILWRYFTVDVSTSANQHLVTSGPYRFVRHPSYTGSLLSFLGLGLVLLDWFSLVLIVIPITAAFIYRIKVEESALKKFFGDQYSQYAAVTKRLIPKIY